jgi:hypothetical protein
MNGSLALRNGVLHVARHARSAEIRTYDMDGGRIGDGFSFAGLSGRPASALGIAVDADMRIWVADGASRAVRTFSVFGGELSAWRSRSEDDIVGGALAEPVSVATSGVEDDTRILVASRGERAHALQLFDRDGRMLQTYRSRGESQTPFRDLARVSMSGRLTFACERKSGLVQVFRDGEFHWALVAPRARGTLPVEPRSVQALSDGRILLATGSDGTSAPGERADPRSAVHLLDKNGVLLKTIAGPGEDTGQVFEPTDLALDEGGSDRRSRFAVVDLDGDRVQVFTLEGVCYGSFADLPRATT